MYLQSFPNYIALKLRENRKLEELYEIEIIDYDMYKKI